jgi:CheY-like chemotaxis protein
MQPLIESCRHCLSVAFGSEPIYVDGDVARLTQVFGNILHNAAKYTGQEGSIWISTEKTGEHAVVHIRDNGPGIPAQMLGEIFEMFQQVDQTLERSYGGLGIGLTLVKRLVELHGGRVEAHSEGLGKGSEFVVYLPLAMAPTNGESDGGFAPVTRRPGSLPRHRVLVVDDVKASAKTLAMMLRSIGQDVAMLHDGPAALDWLDANSVDVVFLDIAMPEMSGYDVARQIRQREVRGRLSLVALTGYGQEDDRRRAIEAGFDHHMTKPTSMEALEHLLATLPVGAH